MNNKQKAAEAGQIMIDYANGATIEQKTRGKAGVWEINNEPNFDWSRYIFRVAKTLTEYWCIQNKTDLFETYTTLVEAQKNLPKWERFGAYIQELKAASPPIGSPPE